MVKLLFTKQHRLGEELKTTTMAILLLQARSADEKFLGMIGYTIASGDCKNHRKYTTGMNAFMS